MDTGTGTSGCHSGRSSPSALSVGGRQVGGPESAAAGQEGLGRVSWPSGDPQDWRSHAPASLLLCPAEEWTETMKMSPPVTGSLVLRHGQGPDVCFRKGTLNDPQTLTSLLFWDVQLLTGLAWSWWVWGPTAGDRTGPLEFLQGWGLQPRPQVTGALLEEAEETGLAACTLNPSLCPLMDRP